MRISLHSDSNDDNLLTPSEDVVKAHVDVLRAVHLDDLHVQVKALNQHPVKCSHEEVVHNDRDCLAEDLETSNMKSDLGRGGASKWHEIVLFDRLPRHSYYKP